MLYFCHVCEEQTEVLVEHQPICLICQSEFVEEVKVELTRVNGERVLTRSNNRSILYKTTPLLAFGISNSHKSIMKLVVLGPRVVRQSNLNMMLMIILGFAVVPILILTLIHIRLQTMMMIKTLNTALMTVMVLISTTTMVTQMMTAMMMIMIHTTTMTAMHPFTRKIIKAMVVPMKRRRKRGILLLRNWKRMIRHQNARGIPITKAIVQCYSGEKRRDRQAIIISARCMTPTSKANSRMLIHMLHLRRMLELTRMRITPIWTQPVLFRKYIIHKVYIK